MAQQSSARIADTVILPCTCAHPFQEEKYGRGRRVHNNCKEGKARCTVCSNLKSGGAAFQKPEVAEQKPAAVGKKT